MRASQEQEFRDRRRRPRIPARWTVYLSRESDSHPLETFTRDLSSEGFYCYVPEPMLPGQRMECTLMLPNHGNLDDGLCLRGSVQVVRLENSGQGFGIGCQILEYNIANYHARPAAVRMETTQSAACPS